MSTSDSISTTNELATTTRWFSTDVWLGITAFLFGALGSALAVRQSPDVHEDAAMLLRYIQNVGTGWGVVYNRGGAHTDGATELMFVLLAGAGVALGASAKTAAFSVSTVSAGLLCTMVYWHP